MSYYAKPWVAVGLSLGVLTIAGCHSSGDTETDSDTVIWKAITFGQSTDLNFASTILPAKIGTNEVLVNGEAVQPGPLAQDFTIESRGGKLANSHDGITFYYTKLSTSKNFTLSADVVVDQIGPETDASPNMQEGAGLMVRDVIGTARQNPQPEGHEEFPAASNMAFNQIRTYKGGDETEIQLSTSYREGIYEPWGTAGNKRTVKSYAENLLVGSQYHMTLSRSNNGFQVSVTTADGETTTDIDGAYPNIVQMIDPDYQYVGFAAARNVKIHVTNAKLEIDADDAKTVDTPKFVAEPAKLRVEISSPTQTAQDAYTVQARANYSGLFSVYQDGAEIIRDKAVAAGDMFAVQTTISGDSSDFVLDYTGTESGMTTTLSSNSFTVTRHSVADPSAVYVSPEGSSTAQGTQADPMSLKEALQLVAPGGTIHLLDGKYASVSLSQSVSGSEGALKNLVADGDNVVFTSRVSVDANYWHLKGMEVAEARLRIKGSYNIFEEMKVHDSPDTGFQISSGDSGRALWASYNQVINVESYNNMDSSRINADGFAAKMRVGDGNTFVNCISHHNIDDGWDLFNKVEDGEDGVVTIKNSVSYSNGRTLDDDNDGNTIGNGFKLGGEGLPVAHVLENNVSYNNNMDGVTDNFNSGSLKIRHVLSVDNARFNFLIRKSPYDDSAASERTFEHNLSDRVNRSSKYNDVVYAHHTSDNWLMQDGESLNSAGEALDQTLAAEIKAAVAYDDGTAAGQRKAALALKAINDARD